MKVKLLRIKHYITISIIVLISIFSFNNSVKAEENYLYIDYKNIDLFNTRLSVAQSRIDTIMNNIVNVYESQGFTFDIKFTPFSDSTKYNIQLSIHYNEQYVQNYNSYYRCDTYTNNIASCWNYINYNVSGGDYYTTNDINFYGDSSDSSFNTKINNTINSIQNYLTSFIKYSDGYVYSGSGNNYNKISFSNNYFVFNINNAYAFSPHYYSTSGLQVLSYTYNDTFGYKFVVDDKIINSGNKIPTYISPLSTSFDDVINTNQYSSVEFTFDLPGTSTMCQKNEYVDGVLKPIEYECPLLDLNYYIANVVKNGNDYEEDMMSFGIPYLLKKQMYDDGTSNITKTDTIPLNNDTNYKYEGNYSIDFTTDITQLKLVIPLDYLDFSYVHIKFDNNLNYTVKYIEKDTSYISNVDITGKAGVMFIPKQIDEDMLVGFDFGVQGLYSLQLRNTYEDNYNVLTYYSIGYCDDRDYINGITNICNNGSGGYQVYLNYVKGNLKQSVFVVNRNYPDKLDVVSTISYDSRYFIYVVYDTLDSTPTFIHPITGEEVNLGDLSNYDDYYSKVSNDSFITTFKNAFNEFKEDISIFLNNVNYFWNGLDLTLKYFYIVIFTLLLLIFLIKFIL